MRGAHLLASLGIDRSSSDHTKTMVGVISDIVGVVRYFNDYQVRGSRKWFNHYSTDAYLGIMKMS